MARVSTYLNFPRSTEQAFAFYKVVFGGDFADPIHRFGEVPVAPGQPPIAPADRDLVMHVELRNPDRSVRCALDVQLREQGAHKMWANDRTTQSEDFTNVTYESTTTSPLAAGSLEVVTHDLHTLFFRSRAHARADD